MSNETPRRQADARGFIDCDAPGPTGQAIVGGLSLDVVQPRVLRFAGRIPTCRLHHRRKVSVFLEGCSRSYPELNSRFAAAMLRLTQPGVDLSLIGLAIGVFLSGKLSHVTGKITWCSIL